MIWVRRQITRGLSDSLHKRFNLNVDIIVVGLHLLPQLPRGVEGGGDVFSVVELGDYLTPQVIAPYCRCTRVSYPAHGFFTDSAAYAWLWVRYMYALVCSYV